MRRRKDLDRFEIWEGNSGDDIKLKFGKYNGEFASDIVIDDREYLIWLSEEFELKPSEEEIELIIEDILNTIY